jgi:hypothetical protein
MKDASYLPSRFYLFILKLDSEEETEALNAQHLSKRQVRMIFNHFTFIQYKYGPITEFLSSSHFQRFAQRINGHGGWEISKRHGFG